MRIALATTRRPVPILNFFSLLFMGILSAGFSVYPKPSINAIGEVFQRLVGNFEQQEALSDWLRKVVLAQFGK